VPTQKLNSSKIDPSRKLIAEQQSMSKGILYIHPENDIVLIFYETKSWLLFEESFLKCPTKYHQKTKHS
jgi:hypothetical protein